MEEYEFEESQIFKVNSLQKQLTSKEHVIAVL